MIKIYISPDEVWDYFFANKDDVGESLILIAETEQGVGVFLSEDHYGNYPVISAEYEGSCLGQECAVTKSDLLKVIEKFYNRAIEYSNIIQCDSPSTPDDSRALASMHEYVNSRESELISSLQMFLMDATGAGEEVFASIGLDFANLSDILDDIEDLLFHSYQVSMYRPRIIETDRGTYIEEYLFDEGVFE